MAGTENFGKEEIMAAADVIERRMIHRYGSHAERAGVYRAEKFEARGEGDNGLEVRARGFERHGGADNGAQGHWREARRRGDNDALHLHRYD